MLGRVVRKRDLNKGSGIIEVEVLWQIKEMEAFVTYKRCKIIGDDAGDSLGTVRLSQSLKRGNIMEKNEQYEFRCFECNRDFAIDGSIRLPEAVYCPYCKALVVREYPVKKKKLVVTERMIVRRALIPNLDLTQVKGVYGADRLPFVRVLIEDNYDIDMKELYDIVMDEQSFGYYIYYR